MISAPSPSPEDLERLRSLLTLMQTRSSLLLRARQGELDEFVRLYAPLIFAMARARKLDEADAHDVVQQTLIELLRIMPGFEYDRSKGRFRGFLQKIVSNRIVDLARARRGVDLAAVAEPGKDDAELNADFDREWLRTRLQSALEVVQREVNASTLQSFLLVVLEERSVQEAAEALGLSPNQVSQNKRRVLLRIREHMERYADELD